MGVAAAFNTSPLASCCCASRAAALVSVLGKASSRLKLPDDAVEVVLRKLTNAGDALKAGAAKRALRYADNPALRSAMRASSTQADGKKLVARIRLGGRLNTSSSFVWRWSNWINKVSEYPFGQSIHSVHLSNV